MGNVLSIGALVYFAIVYLVIAAIFMATWNFTVPRLLKSVQKEYRGFVKIDFATALVALIFLNLLGVLLFKSPGNNPGGVFFAKKFNRRMTKLASI